MQHIDHSHDSLLVFFRPSQIERQNDEAFNASKKAYLDDDDVSCIYLPIRL